MYNEVQQKARNANSLDSIATALDILILIVLGMFVPVVGGILALGWFVIMCIGAKAHHDHVKSLADAPSEVARVFDARTATDFETLGTERQNEAADISPKMRANMDTMTPTP